MTGKSEYLYHVCIPVRGTAYSLLWELFELVAEETGTRPNWTRNPYITLHRPIETCEEPLKTFLQEETARTRQSRVTFSGALDHFGKRYIVLPAQATWETSSLWVRLHERFKSLGGYRRGMFENDNTLHTTIAELKAEEEEIFNRSWPAIRNIRVNPVRMPLTEICLRRKPALGGNWEIIDIFPIPA